MIHSKVLKAFYPVGVFKNVRLPHCSRINHTRKLSATTDGDSSKKANVCSNSDKSQVNYIDEQFFSEVLEYSTNVNIDKSSSKDINNDVRKEISIVNMEDLNEIDSQYFSSSDETTKSEANDRVDSANSYWIYDSIQEVKSDAELLEVNKAGFRPKTIKIDRKESKENDEDVQFQPHERPTSIHMSDEKFDMDSLAKLREELELVRRVNKTAVKRDVVRGVKTEKIPEGQNLPANVRLEELEPSIAEVVKVITKKKPKLKKKTIDFLKLYGTPDPESPLTSVPCCGCGALLHCQDATAGGYLASERFKKLSELELIKTPCQRCMLIMKYNHAINISVTENDFDEMFHEIKDKYALILVMVDLLDFPISFIPNMKTKVGSNKQVMLIGNKIDLLPADSHDCHKRIQKQLRDSSVEHNVCNPEQILNVHLISSKLGYGVEGLISDIQSKWESRGDVYLIGTANSGKSTLFNRLLNSDFCKTKAKWVYKKATVSRWPGTTLNLLKFPILRPNVERIGRRDDRLREQKENDKWRERIEKHDKEFDALGYFRGHVGRSFESDVYDDPVKAFNLISGNKMPSSASLPFKFDPSEFSEGKWLYDTPGIIRDEQVLSKLTAEELKLCVSSQAYRPKTMVIKPGQTIFLAGLGRLDYLQGIQTIFCTMFAAPTLPVRVVDTENADEFYKENVGHPHLKVPAGGAERLETIAPLVACDDVTIKGIHQKHSAADILFASAGWLAITPNQGLEAVLRPYTIGGLGCIVRTPALLPYVVNLRGTRLVRSKPFYRVNVDKLVQYV